MCYVRCLRNMSNAATHLHLPTATASAAAATFTCTGANSLLNHNSRSTLRKLLGAVLLFLVVAMMAVIAIRVATSAIFILKHFWPC